MTIHWQVILALRKHKNSLSKNTSSQVFENMFKFMLKAVTFI